MTSPAMTAAGHHPRHRRLHESRTGTRPAGRQARGHLGVRRRAVRDADGPPAVRAARRCRTRWRPCSRRSRTWTRCRPTGPRATCEQLLRRCLDARSEDAAARHRRGARAPLARQGAGCTSVVVPGRPGGDQVSPSPSARSRGARGRRRLVAGAPRGAGSRRLVAVHASDDQAGEENWPAISPDGAVVRVHQPRARLVGHLRAAHRRAQRHARGRRPGARRIRAGLFARRRDDRLSTNPMPKAASSSWAPPVSRPGG